MKVSIHFMFKVLLYWVHKYPPMLYLLVGMTSGYYVMPFFFSFSSFFFFFFVTVFALKSTLFNISITTQHFGGSGHRIKFFLSFTLSLCMIWNQSLLDSMCNFPDSSVVKKKSACNAGDPGLIPGLGRSYGEGIGYPLHCFGLKNCIDCIVHGVAKS